MFLEPKTLIVVYKDELVLNQLKKLVETNDDSSENGVVGVTDGSVRIVAWTEKVWKDQKKAGNINNKVLFIGNIKDTDKLIPIIDLKYDQYGIKYGWAGNQAIIYVEPAALKKEGYQEFFDEYCKLPIPANMKVNAVHTATDAETPKTDGEKQQDKKRIFEAAKGYIVGGVIGAYAFVSEDVKKKIQLQQFIFGIHQLYANDLEEYLK